LLVDLLVRDIPRLGEAADRMGITLATVKSHLHRVFMKNVKSKIPLETHIC